MLLGDGERPARSGMKQAATEATNDLILDLRRAVAELWGARADAIKAACAPHVPTGRVDEMDALGQVEQLKGFQFRPNYHSQGAG